MGRLFYRFGKMMLFLDCVLGGFINESSVCCGKLKIVFIVFGLLMLLDVMSEVLIVLGGWLLRM